MYNETWGLVNIAVRCVTEAALEKVLFALDIDDGWPPVSSEGVWCEREGRDYKLVNAPFFIKGLAYGDIFKAEPDKVNEHIFEFEVIGESGHSLVWALNNKHIEIHDFKKRLLELGCSFEGFEQFSLYSIDIPETTDKVGINNLIDEYEVYGLDFAFPVWRHEVENT